MDNDVPITGQHFEKFGVELNQGKQPRFGAIQHGITNLINECIKFTAKKVSYCMNQKSNFGKPLLKVYLDLVTKKASKS
jgi:Zn-dependent oligopeptidase